jgi:hypothetical protein
MRQILIEKYIKPSKITIDFNSVIECWLDKYDNLHSFLGQPSSVLYVDKKMHQQTWHKKGVINRDKDLPAVLFYKLNKIKEKQWWKNGFFHREGDKPAVLFYKKRKVVQEHWCKKGEFHREGNMPSSIYYNKKK